MKADLPITAVLGGLLLAGLVDCRCANKKQPPSKPKTRSTIRSKPVFRFPSSMLRKRMRELNMEARELRRQVKGGFVANSPEILQILGQMQTSGVPKSFVSGLATMKKATKQLGASKQLRKDYGLFVEACISCHQKLAVKNIGHVTRLRLPIRETKKP